MLDIDLLSDNLATPECGSLVLTLHGDNSGSALAMLSDPTTNTWASIATGSPNTLNIDTSQTTADLDLLSKTVTT